MQKISIPRAFFEDNFDVEMAMQEGLQVQISAAGQELDTDIDNLFLYKYQNPSGELTGDFRTANEVHMHLQY